MKNCSLIVAALCSLAVGGGALAHHSFAMFDQAKEVSIAGTLKEVQWANPHIWIQIVVDGKGGEKVEWSIEGASLNTVKRWGWKRTDFKPGDKVTAVINPMRDGKNGGSLKVMRSSNGMVWGTAAAK